MNYYLEFFFRIISSFSAPLSFIHSTVYLYQSGLMNIYFILWDKIQYSFCHSNHLGLGHWKHFKTSCHANVMRPVFVCFVYTSSYFLALQESLGSSCILLAPALKSSITLRNSGVFYHNILFRSQNLSTRGVHYYWSVTTMVRFFKNWFHFYTAFISKSCLEKNSKNAKNLHI